ncbi:hypothetical protein CANTEDRAFT_113353 [Yamadazyma tenuis ATCC 10573]|uniref:Uncharacterized protein n=1 Tax=Candida tenuis (strain ATCC 10573 / BCRC 21748 / CBS 615 / JCM 9827 / NBRC 10315 / NRRL Y-1498 / VKM Y-70) TaxID=590646 RepID=G3B224_CANTC|nr:uncharacterized protein CANTEDRAFT_113353 [Yamadazyma tenuis ATCC 10573]XP_006685842.1 uncharacterized protein CANTEDRAFT_113353 [Yamadazyma tenuis ATCC 10573]EGV65035.1 hypothetical protein CANTEDRAFT_113353 [Yamadazyma tenuis ATCC 10573]EGV65036.1 hypothetical protein CANTEDRAFT_113353 [Yamadazyma tenuis ATCC 10573]
MSIRTRLQKFTKRFSRREKIQRKQNKERINPGVSAYGRSPKPFERPGLGGVGQRMGVL